MNCQTCLLIDLPRVKDNLMPTLQSLDIRILDKGKDTRRLGISTLNTRYKHERIPQRTQDRNVTLFKRKKK